MSLNEDEQETVLLVEGNGTGALGEEGRAGAIDEERGMLVEIERVSSEGGTMETRVNPVSGRSSCCGWADPCGNVTISTFSLSHNQHLAKTKEKTSRTFNDILVISSPGHRGRCV
jgi:hypothetical protein